MSYPSSSQRTINFENFTDQDIEDLKTFISICAKTWTTEIIHDNPNSEMNKLGFIPALENFTDELLDRFIKIESTFNYVTGTFFSIDQVTVNNILVHEILNNHIKGNVESVRKYSLL